MEGFDGFKSGTYPFYAFPSTIWDLYSNSANLSIVDGRNGGKAFDGTGGAQPYFTKHLASHTTAIIGMAFHPRNNTTGIGGGFQLFTNTLNGWRVQCMVAFSFSAQTWRIYRANNNSNYYTGNDFNGNCNYTDIAGSGYYAQNDWNYIEYKIVAGAPGALTIRVNDAVVVDALSTDTAYGYVAANYQGIQLGYVWNPTWPGFYGYYDDIYYLSGDATAPNDFIGDCNIGYIVANGAGRYAEFETLTGAAAHYQAVDDADYDSVDGDATRVASSVLNARDTFALSDLASPMNGNIIGIQSEITMRKTDAGSRIATPMVRLASADLDNSPVTVFDTYRTYASIFTTKPGGGSYTVADVNNMEIGVKVSGP